MPWKPLTAMIIDLVSETAGKKVAQAYRSPVILVYDSKTAGLMGGYGLWLLWGHQWDLPRWCTQPNIVHNLYWWSARVTPCEWAWLFLGGSLLWGLMLCKRPYSILAPSPDALRKMLTGPTVKNICSGLWDSIQCHLDSTHICFRRSACSSQLYPLSLCGQHLTLADSVVHLGNTLQHDLSIKQDIQVKSMAFIHQDNYVLFNLRIVIQQQRWSCIVLIQRHNPHCHQPQSGCSHMPIPHTYSSCGKHVDKTGLHGLSCQSS